MRPGLPHQPARRQAQQRHDVVPGQLRADRGDLLLLGQPGDPFLQRVVRGSQRLGLAPVTRRAVRAHELVQSGQLRPGVVDVPAHRRVRPLTAPVAVEAQVQEHQQSDRVRDVLGEAQRGQTPAGHVAPDHLVMMEGDTAPWGVPAGPWLSDVVQQRGPAQHLVRTAVGWRVLQGDGLAQHGQGVGVDVLVLVVLVDLHPQCGQFGQHDVGDADVHQTGKPRDGIGRNHEFAQLVPDAFHRNDLQPGCPRTHRRDQFRHRDQPELGLEAGRAQDAQRVVVEGCLGGAGCAQHLAGEVAHTAEQVDELVTGYGHRHGVDGEVAADEVPLEGVAIGDHRIPRGAVICLGPVGGDLEPYSGPDQPDGAEGDPRLPDPVRPAAGDVKDLFGTGVRGEVEVGTGHAGRSRAAGRVRGAGRARTAQQGVPDGSADQIQAVAGVGEDPSEIVSGSRHLEQCADRPLRGVTWVVQADHRHCPRV